VKLSLCDRRITRRQIRLLSLGLVWPVILLLIALGASGAIAEVATSDPDWNGSPPENISHSDLDRARQPDIDIGSSGEAVIVWSDETAANGRDIYFTSGTVGAWAAPQVLSDTAESSLFPYVLAVGDRHFVAWVDGLSPQDRELFETEVGAGETRAIPSPAAPELLQPCLAASTDRLHVVFGASNVYVPDLYHSSRPLAGGAWEQAQIIHDSPIFFESTDPALAAGPDGNSLHLVWENKSSTASSIMYMSGTVSGAAVSWSSAITLSTGITFSIRPDIAVASNGDIHVTWGETIPGETPKDLVKQYVRYIRYEAGSGTWGTSAVRIDLNPVWLNEDSPTYIGPAIAVWEHGDETKVCIAWHGFRDGDPSAEEILVRCSSDGGSTWPSATENVSRSTTEAGWEVSIRPLMAFDAQGALHVVWQERAGSDLTQDYEAYYSASRERIFLPLVLKNN
jgi:hypothetical protein